MEAENARVIALDVGDVRMGVAVSDPTGVIAQPLETYRRVGYKPDCQYVLGLCERYQTKRVVLGLPLNMDGTRGSQADKAAAFGEVLARAGLEVCYQDERLTTVTADSVLIGGGVSRADRKRYVDKLAATVILEQWLQTEQNRCAGKRNLMDDREDVVQLVDEDGIEANFLLVMTVDINDKRYIVLEAAEDTDSCKEGDDIILRVVHDDEHDEDTYVTIEDEDEYNDVCAQCEAIMLEDDTDDESEDDLEALDGDDDTEE